jgi:hypothetical protein
MDLQAILRETCFGKSVIVVGNAKFSRDRADFVDSHDLIFRFNEFHREWFGLNGHRIDFWFNNLGRRGVGWRDGHCALVKTMNPSVIVGTPHEQDGLNRLHDARSYYPQHGIQFVFPDEKLETATVTPKQPTTGFYTIYRLLSAGIPVVAIGFSGAVSRHHDGEAEMKFLRNHCQVTLDMDFN